MSQAAAVRHAVSIVGPDGPDKTAFVAGLARALEAAGVRVAVLSLDSSFPLPDLTKDTGRYRAAGAFLAALAAPGWLLLTYRLSPPHSPPPLDRVLELLAPWADAVLVDGEAAGLECIRFTPLHSSGKGSWGVLLGAGEEPAPAEQVDRIAAWLRQKWGLP